MSNKARVRIGSDGTNARIVGLPASPRHQSQYMRGNNSPFFYNWRPALRDNRDDVRAGYVEAAARTIDGIHNSGWLAGAVDQSISSMIGSGLRLASKPDAEILGWKKSFADQWSRTVERRFEAWAKNPIECDAAGKHSLGQQARVVVKSYYTHGEVLALLPMVRRSVSVTRTKVKLLPPHKLVQDSDGDRLFQGVQMDAWGLPISYRLRLRLNGAMEETVTVAARDGAGRPQVVHIFDGGADQVRGITPLAPALRIVRQYDQLSDAKLQHELIRAIFAATVHSDAPTDQILNALRDDSEQGVGSGSMDEYLGAKADWYQSTKIDLGRAGRIAHLFPGEKLEFHSSSSNADDYEAFAKFLLREIARCLGMTFETLTGDYSGATYSSVRMATSEIWPLILSRRENIAGRFYQQVFEAWLEEEIENGRIEFPGGFYAFIAHREAASRADWRGPAKPQADDLKTAKAHEVYKRLGVVTDEQICAELGTDWQDVMDQRAHERDYRESLGLPEGDAMATEDRAALEDKLSTEDA